MDLHGFDFELLEQFAQQLSEPLNCDGRDSKDFDFSEDCGVSQGNSGEGQ